MIKLKIFSGLIIIIFFSSVISSYSQNPISPPGMYIADPSAKVFNENLFIYGSLDESCNHYCSNRHNVIETSDLITWKIHENVFSSVGKNDGVPYNDDLLFAPDCAEKDGKYFMYYCQPNAQAEGVAVANYPQGPFKNGIPLQLLGHNQIDPSVFIDEDGTAYYIWGQFALKMAKLKPSMLEIDTLTFRDSVITEKQHFFHEGGYLTKRNGTYYLVYADISRAEMPTCIGYATSSNVYGPYTYQGVIIDNRQCNPGNWNNHGSIIEFKNQWYVLYHRSTHGCNTMRKACIEPIFFTDEGLIPEVEMTTQGVLKPLSSKIKLEAERACILQGNVRIEQFEPSNEKLSGIANGDKACFKYLDFNNASTKVTVRVASKKGGQLSIKIDQPWHKTIATIDVPSSDSEIWRTYSTNINPVEGIHALWIDCFGGTGELFDIDWIIFE